MNIASSLLCSYVPLTFFSFIMASISIFNFMTKLNDMKKNKDFLMILLGWTMAMLGGTNRENRDEVYVLDFLMIA